MKREEAMQILQIYKDEIEQRIDEADAPDVKDVYRWQMDGFCMAIEALQAETIQLSVADKIGEERERLQEKVAELQEKNADRPNGVWEYTEVTTDNDTYSEWVCSECGGSGYELMDFCPWCGADMRGEDE